MNRDMQAKHWLAIGLFLVGLAGVVGSLDHWSDAIKPSFVAAVLTQAGGAIVALFTGAPKKTGLTGKYDAVDIARFTQKEK